MLILKKSVLFFLFCIDFFFSLINRVNNRILRIISQFQSKTEIACRQKLTPSISTFVEDNNWYCKESLIAHACGSYKGLPYTNSQEALSESISKAFNVFEVDVRCTKDSVLVCRHDAFTVPSLYADYINRKIDFRFSSLSLFDCVNTITNENGIAIIDVKEKCLLERVVDQLKNKNGIYIQISSEKEFEKAKGLNVLYNIDEEKDYCRVSLFCLTNYIHVVSVNKTKLLESDAWMVLLESNIKIFAHTVNSLAEFFELKSKGVQGVFTDYLCQEDLRELQQ